MLLCCVVCCRLCVVSCRSSLDMSCLLLFYVNVLCCGGLFDAVLSLFVVVVLMMFVVVWFSFVGCLTSFVVGVC